MAPLARYALFLKPTWRYIEQNIGDSSMIWGRVAVIHGHRMSPTDCDFKNVVIFNSYVSHYQRVVFREGSLGGRAEAQGAFKVTDSCNETERRGKRHEEAIFIAGMIEGKQNMG